MLVERPELAILVDEIGRGRHPTEQKALTETAEDRTLSGYMLLNYSLFERVYLLYAKKWIDEETWGQ